MKNNLLKKVSCAAIAVFMAATTAFSPFAVYALDGERGEVQDEKTPVNSVLNVPSTQEQTSVLNPDSYSDSDEKPVVTNNNIYITNYRVVDAGGNPVTKIVPGDKVIIAVTVIDERIENSSFGVPSGSQTSRIHINMTQGAFSINSAANITSKMRNTVTVPGNYEDYDAICYTVEFRDVVYQGGSPEFSFNVSYTGKTESGADSNMPLAVPQKLLSFNVTEAVDDVPAPTIILNSANYGKVATVGETFSLVTVATNTSENLELENVSLKIELPTGLNLSSGNSQILVGKVGKKGSINHTFSLVAEGVGNDTTSLPVKLIYTFEAFVNGKRTQYTSEQSLSINVQQPTRFSIQSSNIPAEVYMGSEGYASLQLVNKGKTTVYNVTAEIVSEQVSGSEVEFLGNIAPGTNSEAEFYFTANELGTAVGKIVVTYEDASGKQSTLEREFSLNVMENIPFDPGITDPVVVPEEPKTSPIVYILGLAVVAGAGGFVFYKKKKAKRLAELEEDDEDI